jgi:hypothetical protein
MIADGVDETPDGNGWFVGRLNAGVPVPVGRLGSLAQVAASESPTANYISSVDPLILIGFLG